MSTNNGEPERGVATIVLAAGLGTRMKSRRAKVLHEICGEPIIVRLARKIAGLSQEPPPRRGLPRLLSFGSRFRKTGPDSGGAPNLAGGETSLHGT